MRVTFINVGYGDAILFQASNGYTLLLDGGSDLPEEFAGDAYRIRGVDYLQSQGVTHLDAVVISHIHEDHVCGLEPILRQIPAKQLFTPYPVEPFLRGRELTPAPDAPRSVPLYTKALNAYRRILENAVAAGTPIRVLSPGDGLELTTSLVMQALAPRPDSINAYMDLLRQAFDPAQSTETVTALLTALDSTSNGTSLLLRFEAEGCVFLMAADSCPREWTEVPSFLLENVNVLKLPHHGQIDSIDEHFMENMPLAYVVTTASSDRRYHSAHAKVYERLTAMRPEGQAPQYLFTDERQYPPYFSQPDGFQAITLVIKSGTIVPEFIKTK
jgi:competence protein ComEC